MGQRSSSQRPQEAPAKKSYYELLEIEKDATEDEIKKAYRRKALELHPDRNYGHVEEATRLFAEIQSAYEVLSDTQERAWYDSHESAVLSGFADGENTYDGGVPVTTSDDIVKLYANFGGRNDFTDSPDGFYSSLREIFDRLAKEESLVGDSSDLGSQDYPSFGSADDSYAEVAKPFYDVWSGFSTRKTFAWKEVYRLSDAPDRRVRRAMEKENKRLRDEAIREFNDTIRTLVAFVKKRDPRVKSAQTISETQRQQMLRDQTAAQAARARAANTAKLDAHIEASWVKHEAEHYNEEFIWSEEEPEVAQQFECVVCNKVFKNEKQYEAHERSKKHVQAVKKIQRQMRKEGVDLGIDNRVERAEEDSDQENEVEQPRTLLEEMDISGREDQRDEPENITEPDTSVQQVPTEEETDHDVTSGEITDEDYAPRNDVFERLAGTANVTDFDEIRDDTATPEKKPGKAKEKRARKAAKKAETPGVAPGLACARCGNQFPSKSQLFNHLKSNPSHAQPIQKDKAIGRGGKKK